MVDNSLGGEKQRYLVKHGKENWIDLTGSVDAGDVDRSMSVQYDDVESSIEEPQLFTMEHNTGGKKKCKTDCLNH